MKLMKNNKLNKYIINTLKTFAAAHIDEINAMLSYLNLKVEVIKDDTES